MPNDVTKGVLSTVNLTQFANFFEKNHKNFNVTQWKPKKNPGYNYVK